MDRRVWALLLLAITGCGRQSGENVSMELPINEAASQGSAGVLEKQLEVDTLYLAEDGNQIIAAGNRQGVIVEPGKNRLAWGAWECDNPQCPGRKPGGTPLLFPWPNPFYFIKEDGTIAMRQPITEAELLQADESREVRCPACLKIRNLASETPQQRLQYRTWCRQHVLPRAAEQRKNLEDDYRRRLGK